MKIDPTYRHVYLYAKGWYKKSNSRLDDMKKIFEDICGVEKEYISNEHVARVLTRLVMNFYSKDRFEKILMGAIGVSDLWDEREGVERYVGRMSSALFEVTGESPEHLKETLGEPDPEILPLRREVKEAKATDPVKELMPLIKEKVECFRDKFPEDTWISLNEDYDLNIFSDEEDNHYVNIHPIKENGETDSLFIKVYDNEWIDDILPCN